MSPTLAPHQLVALQALQPLLERFGGAIYADGVGMGKSWVAAAVARAWQKRGLRSAFVVPATLIPQWTELLRDFFVEAEVRSHESLLSRELPAEARLIVVDEAHRFRNPATRRYRALALQVVGRTLLLVTATPVVNRADDLLALLRLFAADDVLADRAIPSLSEALLRHEREEARQVIAALMIRQGQVDLPPALRFGNLSRRVVVNPDAISQEAIEGALEQLRFPLLAPSGGAGVLRAFLRRRLASSEAALRATLRRQRRFYRRAREALLEGSRISKAEILSVFGREDEDSPFQDLLFKPWWFGSGDPASADFAEIDREVSVLDRALSASSSGESPKAALLLELLAENGVLPALLFTASVATAIDLFRRCGATLRAGLVTSRQCSLRHVAARGAVFEAFMRGEIDLLIATDLGAEGLNLQRAASVIHYDLPWNAVRLDQRNGRARRIGQKRETVRSIVFVPREGRRDRVVATLLRKEVRRRALLGGHAQTQPCFNATLPPALGDARVRLQWRDALIARGRFDSHWESRLAASYPAGVDIWLAEHAAEALTLIDEAAEMVGRAGSGRLL